MIVYKTTDGFAHDLRYEDQGYVLVTRELKHSDGFGELPDLQTLHDPIAVQTQEEAIAAEKSRLQALKEDTLAQDLLNRLQAATPTQINNYVDNNVTDLASARTMFKRILLVMAIR